MTLEQYYREYRRKGWQAKWAIRAARTMVEWDKHEDVDVKLEVHADDICNMDDLKGDIFNPDRVDHLTPERLKREEKEFEQQVYNEGVWGIVTKVRCKCCGEWHTADSVWGFVGDQWMDSGYDIDVKAEALDQIGVEI